MINREKIFATYTHTQCTDEAEYDYRYVIRSLEPGFKSQLYHLLDV